MNSGTLFLNRSLTHEELKVIQGRAELRSQELKLIQDGHLAGRGFIIKTLCVQDTIHWLAETLPEGVKVTQFVPVLSGDDLEWLLRAMGIPHIP
jgi:hypothetical protein